MPNGRIYELSMSIYQLKGVPLHPQLTLNDMATTVAMRKPHSKMNYALQHPENEGGMNERVKRLHQQSIDTPTTLTIERALIETAFYKENYGKMPNCILRARNFYEICKKKTIYIGEDELIVGERGPMPKAV